ncbi:hypothetical protein Tco_1281858 [Tanacetum coccineum]
MEYKQVLRLFGKSLSGRSCLRRPFPRDFLIDISSTLAPTAPVGFAPQWIGWQNLNNNNGWLDEDDDEEPEEDEADEDNHKNKQREIKL